MTHSKEFHCKIGNEKFHLIAFLSYPNIAPAISITEADSLHQRFRVEFRLSPVEVALKNESWENLIEHAITLFHDRKFPQQLENIKTYNNETKIYIEKL